MSKFQVFPVTITGINVSERNVQPPNFKSAVDKVGITIQQTNVIDRDGNNVVVPEGTWLNGVCPPGKMDNLAVGQTVEISISTKPKNDGGFWYNFNYYPEKEPTAAPAPAPVAPQEDFVTREEFQAAIKGLEDKIDGIF